MIGKLYAVGVGPRDPKLLTLKAVETIKNADCIACPKSKGEPGIAYKIAEWKMSVSFMILNPYPMKQDTFRF
jgi:precorrin-2/cobalt-factor-2 C20-methyltransferase